MQRSGSRLPPSIVQETGHCLRPASTHRRIDSIAPRDADRFLGRLQDLGLTDASIKSNIGNIKAVMRLVVKDYPDHFHRSPFAHINVKIKPKKGTWRYVPYEEVLKVFEACPDRANKLGWQMFLALCRFSGLRAFSEALELKKADVDLMSDPPLIKVYASKTARQSGKPSRVVPVLYPILNELLVRSLSETSPAEHLVPSGVPRARSDAHRTLKVVLRRAELVDEDNRVLWRPAFQVLRACSEKGFLGLGLFEYRYCRAIGHGATVSPACYLAKSEDATLEDDAHDEFQAATERVKSQPSHPIPVHAGYTADPVECTETEMIYSTCCYTTNAGERTRTSTGITPQDPKS